MAVVPPASIETRRVPSRAASAVPAAPTESELLRKPVNTLAIVPKSARITLLGRKSYNVLLFEAQDQGLDKDVFRAPLERIIRGVDFDSHDHALVKKHLRAMVSTTVEWQSPTTGEGASWNVSGLLAHARLSKERGQVWIEWSYAVNLKQELLEPTVFARLKLEVISQLRSHAAVALYEICTRYKDVGRTARQAWRWWRPVLSGQPETERTARLEYRVFKRDTLKPAVAEVNAITDLDVALVEHKQGRFVDEIQFTIQIKKQAALPLTRPPRPVDIGLVARASRLGVSEETTEALLAGHGEDAVRAGLDTLERRLASAFPEPLRDPQRYLKSLMPSHPGAPSAAPAEASPEEAAPASRPEAQARRQARWHAEWLRRRREQIAAELAALPAERQAELCARLLGDMVERDVHPSIRKRLQTSGWRHPMVLPEMLRCYAADVYGPQWDQPSAEQLLAIATETGEG